jgi:ABC-type maltose transport system permease subunit
MKKSLIGAIVGGIIIFLWQFLSWTIINLHQPAQQFTEKQDAIMPVLNSNLQEGGYYMPAIPANSSWAEHEKAMNESIGKPWATIQYHKALENNMVMNMIRGLFVNIIIVWLACWLFLRMNKPGFGTILTASVLIGLIVFLNSAYTMHIWYQTFDLMAHFLDSVVSWAACGVWLAWWLTRNKKNNDHYNRSVSNVERLNVG